MKCLDPHFPQTLSKPACLCCGATLSTTCCIMLPLIPKTLCCLEIVYTDLASQMVKKNDISHMRIQACSFFKQPSFFIYRLIRTIAGQWRAWPWSVPSKPARLGPGRIQLSFQLAFMCCWQNFVKRACLIPVMFV